MSLIRTHLIIFYDLIKTSTREYCSEEEHYWLNQCGSEPFAVLFLSSIIFLQLGGFCRCCPSLFCFNETANLATKHLLSEGSPLQLGYFNYSHQFYFLQKLLLLSSSFCLVRIHQGLNQFKTRHDLLEIKQNRGAKSSGEKQTKKKKTSLF